MRLRRIIQDYDRIGGEIYYRKERYEHNPELLDAYECGYEDALHEMRDGYYERRGNVTHYGAGGRILYRRDDDRMYDDDDVEYRRRRDSMGRYR